MTILQALKAKDPQLAPPRFFPQRIQLEAYMEMLLRERICEENWQLAISYLPSGSYLVQLSSDFDYAEATSKVAWKAIAKAYLALA